MASIDKEYTGVRYVIELDEHEMDVLRDIMWHEVAIGDVERAGLKESLYELFGNDYSTNGSSSFVGRSGR